MPRLRLAFMGTPDFAAASLAALIAAGHDIAAVYSQPPRPAGRGQQPRPSPVQRLAESHGLPVLTPTSLKTPEAQQEFAALRLDAAVVVAYGLLLPRAILESPRLRLPQCPCLAAAALAGGGPDPARHPRRRPGERHHHHADGPGAGYRPDAAPPGPGDRPAGDRRRPA